jgi:hypothetical protein
MREEKLLSDHIRENEWQQEKFSFILEKIYGIHDPNPEIPRLVFSQMLDVPEFQLSKHF